MNKVRELSETGNRKLPSALTNRGRALRWTDDWAWNVNAHDKMNLTNRRESQLRKTICHISPLHKTVGEKRSIKTQKTGCLGQGVEAGDRTQRGIQGGDTQGEGMALYFDGVVATGLYTMTTTDDMVRLCLIVWK